MVKEVDIDCMKRYSPYDVHDVSSGCTCSEFKATCYEGDKSDFGARKFRKQSVTRLNGIEWQPAIYGCKGFIGEETRSV